MPAEQPKWIRDALLSVGDRVRVARLYENKTQERLAEETGLDRSTIQRIEGGQDVKFSHLLRIAQALRIPVRNLLP